MFSFNSQISKKDGKEEFAIQITTDDYEQFHFMQAMARRCLDGKHNLSETSPGKPVNIPEYIPPTIANKTGWYGNDACKDCSVNPSNGGSGNCNCTLGLPTFYYGVNHE